MRRAVLLLAAALSAAFAAPAAAHFSAGAKLRTILIAREDGGLAAYVRAPLPLLFGDVVARARAAGRPLETPFLYPERAAGGLRYRLSMETVAAEGDVFRARLAEALTFAQNGVRLPAQITAFRIRLRAPDAPFGDAAAARAALDGEGPRLDPVFGEAVVEARYALAAPAPSGPVAVAAGFPPLPLPDGVSVDNHLRDLRADPPVSITAEGQFASPVMVDGSALAAFLAFLGKGVRHILAGPDHVLLVACLALGAGLTRRLLRLVTGFTLGHSATLIGAFFGLAPGWSWFPPAVEVAIAGTILWAAIAAARGGTMTAGGAAAVGLLHGLGFSQALSGALGREAPNLVEALLAFNLGIEIGQIAIVALVLLALASARRMAASAERPVRLATLGVSGLVASLWLVERVAPLV